MEPESGAGDVYQAIAYASIAQRSKNIPILIIEHMNAIVAGPSAEGEIDIRMDRPRVIEVDG